MCFLSYPLYKINQVQDLQVLFVSLIFCVSLNIKIERHMNIKTMTVCLVCAGALLVSCGSNREKKAGDTDEMEKPEMIGGDKESMDVLLRRDIHGVKYRKIASVCGRKVCV